MERRRRFLINFKVFHPMISKKNWSTLHNSFCRQSTLISNSFLNFISFRFPYTNCTIYYSFVRVSTIFCYDKYDESIRRSIHLSKSILNYYFMDLPNHLVITAIHIFTKIWSFYTTNAR